MPIKAKGDFSQLFYSFSREISCDPETPLFINTAHVVVSWLVNVAVSELMNITRAGRRSPSGGKFKTSTCCVLRARARCELNSEASDPAS